MNVNEPNASQLYEDPNALVFSVRDLAFQMDVTTAILGTLDIDQILYVVLSGLTSGEGLGFNRALFMLADEAQRSLRISLAIGPSDEAEAHRIWEEMKAKELTLTTLLSFYDSVKHNPATYGLTQRLGDLELPLHDLARLATASAPPGSSGTTALEPMLARCLLERRVLWSTSMRLGYTPPAGQEAFHFRNWCMAPLLASETVVGMLVADNAFTASPLTPRVRSLLVALANLAALAVEKGRLFARMRALAEVDGLTGLANRRTYDQTVSAMINEATRTGRAVALVVLDIDHFKDLNDRVGHLAGDDALRAVAAALAGSIRKVDLAARYGGEEFALLLPDTDLAQAHGVAQKLLEAVRQRAIAGGLGGPVTVSAGVAASVAGAMDPTTLFATADRALYAAKNAGRDRVASLAALDALPMVDG